MNDETKTLATIIRHQKQVSFLLRELAREFERRADLHDMSKFELDELEGFILLDKGRGHQKEEYGSTAYEDGIKLEAVKKHQLRNRHHPEFWPNGLADMNFIDVVEMLCDWEIARQMRDTEGDMQKTWDMRQKRFDLSDEDMFALRFIWERIEW